MLLRFEAQKLSKTAHFSEYPDATDFTVHKPGQPEIASRITSPTNYLTSAQTK
jgi:hypothetical protein